MALYKLAMKGYTLPGVLADSKANAAGAWFGDNVGKLLRPFYLATRGTKFKYGPGLDSNVRLPGWLGGAGLGSAVGAGAGGLFGLLTGKDIGSSALTGAALGGIGLGGIGYTQGDNPDWATKLGLKRKRGIDALNADPDTLGVDEEYIMNKYGSIQKSAFGLSHGDPVTAKIFRDTALTLRQKQELASQVGYLNDQQKRRLNQLVGGAFGGGVGMLVAKYLLGLGKFGTILTTIVSGLAGARMAGGRASKSPYDNLGRPYYM